MVAAASKRGNTRERILDVAFDLFVEQGFTGASISEIERRVGLAAGNGAFYRHFSSKEAVLRAAAEREVNRFRETTENVRTTLLPQVADPIERQVTLYEHMLHELKRVDGLFRLMLNEGDRVPELRTAIWSALDPPSGAGQIETVARAALGGYHLFSIMQGRPYNGVDEREFLRTLAELAGPNRRRRAQPKRTGGGSTDKSSDR